MDPRFLVTLFGSVVLIGCGVRDPISAVFDAGPKHEVVPFIHKDCGPVNWNQQIQPIVQTYCLRCHSDPPMFGAPHALVSFADTQADSVEYADLIEVQVIGSRVADGSMPQSPPRPVASEMALIQQWVESGAPEHECPTTDGGISDAGL